MSIERRQRYRRIQKERVLDETATRKRQLGRIHQGKKALGLDDETYRALLVRVAGKPSSADMTHEERNQVLAEMARLGLKEQRVAARKRVFAGKPKNVQDVPMLRKVEALLADARRPWSYAHGLAKRMYQITRVEWLNEHQLHNLISALQADANRRKASASKEPQ